jgi:glycosyltransferase involved in cell wall biosynthesis
MKVINVGIYPPPYGGISVHLKRLLEYLQSKGQECLLIDLSPYPKNQADVVHYTWRETIWFLLASAPTSIVHFHNFSLKNTFFYFLISRRHKTILSFHNERFLDELNSWGAFWRAAASFFLNHLDYFVVDTPHCERLAAEIVEDKTRIVIIPEFIPPSSIPPLGNKEIMAMRQKYHHLLSSNAFQISFHKGEDLYGLDMLVELVSRLVQVHAMDVGMVFLLPNIGNLEYFQEINDRIESRGLTEHFRFITEPVEESVSVWQISDIVIRATNTDGNSLTVMEALSLEVPVIASDCVERPEGTILFETRDVDDLCNKVLTVLAASEHYRARLKDIHPRDNAAAFLALYEDMGRMGKNQL